MPKKKKLTVTEEQELENAFRDMIGGENPEKKKGGGAVFAIILALLIVAAGAVFFYLVQAEMSRVIQADVTIAGIQMQGMTQRDAIAAVDAAYAPEAVTVTVLEHSVELPADCVLKLRTWKAVRAACNLTGSASLTLDLTPYLVVDKARVQELLAPLKGHYNTTLKESTYEVTGTAPEQTLIITMGKPEYGLDMDKLYSDAITTFGKGETLCQEEITLLEPKAIDLDAIWAEYCKAPVDALYHVQQKKLVGGDAGYGFDLEATKAKLETAKYGEVLEFPFTELQPAVTREAVEATLFQDVLGTFTAKSSSKKNRDVNLGLACKSISGIIMYPGDTFSYNETLGERTAEKGYKPAGTYVGGETVNTYGGGICQVSSSLYYSVLCAEMEVIERTNHGFLPSYMPRGLDATVNWGTLDFQFRNNLDYPIRIEAVAKGGKTTVTIYGTETRNYRVKLGAVTISKTAYETEYQVMEANNKDGYKDGHVLVTPYTGYYVESYIYRYELDSDKLISKDYIDDSRYRVRNKVVVKIESETPVPPAEDTPSGETPTPPAPDNTETP